MTTVDPSEEADVDRTTADGSGPATAGDPATHTEAGPAAWSVLDADAKRARVLRVAGELFARDGLDVPMPVLADAIGVGVGSIYRQIGRKEDIVAALVVERFALVTGILERALDAPEPWPALCGATYDVVAAAVDDQVTHEAWDASSEHPDVLTVRPRTTAALEALVDRARDAGALRDGAGADDLRLIFRAAKGAEDLGPGGARRLAELALRGMATDGRAG